MVTTGCDQSEVSPGDRPTAGAVLETTPPAQAGFNPAALNALNRELRGGAFGNVHAVLIARNGKLASEQYFSGDDETYDRGKIGKVAFDSETPHDIRSMTKTVVSTLVGIAIAQGHIPSVDTPVHELLPSHAHLLTGPKRAIKLRHLLTMSGGLRWDESVSYADDRNDEIRMDNSIEPTAFVLSRELVAKPGTVWNYSGGATHLLAAIVEARTGKPIEDYAGEMLFGPLGIKRFQWQGDLGGVPAAASGLRLTARDMMKLALMISAGGRWQDRRIVPEKWVQDALRPHIHVPAPKANPDWIVSSAYGYQWWIDQFRTAAGPVQVSSAIGNGGQRIFLVPKLDLVIVTLAGEYNNKDAGLVPETILLRTIAALAPAGATAL